MKICKVKEICSKGSSNLRQKDVEGKMGLYPVYGASGVISNIDIYHQDNEYIAIVKDGSGIGRVSFMPPKSSVIGTMQYILPKEGYDIRYIGYCLQSLDLSKYKQGAAIPHIYFRDYGERNIRVCENIDEQCRIVSYLDSSFDYIDKIKKNASKSLSEAKALFQSALAEAMEPKEGWEEKTLKDLCEIYGNYGLSVPSIPFNGIRYLRITDITEWGELNNDKVSADVDSSTQQKLEDGDILFARTGATVGKTLMFENKFGECLFAGYLIRYRVDRNKILPKFLFYLTHSKEYYEWIKNNQKAAAQPNISAKLYNNYIINYPSLSTQKQIVSRLDSLSSKVRAIEEKYQKMIAECDAMKQAMLREVFE